MFLKNLQILNEDTGKAIRDIHFTKGVNIITDVKTGTEKTESGNSVGKTTVLRLIDYCLGGNEAKIYKDPEFKSTGDEEVRTFLHDNNIVIILILTDNLDGGADITIKRNFLNRKKKILTINEEQFTEIESFKSKLKQLLFNLQSSKPSLREIVAKNIRYEDNKLVNAIRVLDTRVSDVDYEAFYLFLLGLNTEHAQTKKTLTNKIKFEEKIQDRLNLDKTEEAIIQEIHIIDRSIAKENEKKDNFNINNDYKEDFEALDTVRQNINKTTIALESLKMRRALILESQISLEKDISNVDANQIKFLYEKAKSLIPSIQTEYEKILAFHNQMVQEKIKFITKELPELEKKISNLLNDLTRYLGEERTLVNKLHKTSVYEDINEISKNLTDLHLKKGILEEKREQWRKSIKIVAEANEELAKINNCISEKDILRDRVAKFNEFFPSISKKLYNEEYYLVAEQNEKVLKLTIGNISGNVGTGKKKGQMVAFDLAYIQFCDALNLSCLHFLLYDQVEGVDNNQLTTVFFDIVSQINCQYVVSILSDKLPTDINIQQYIRLTLSQGDKLFKI